MWQPMCTCNYGVCSVNMDGWYYRISVACVTMEFESFSSHLCWYGPLPWPSQAICHTHAPTFNKRIEKKKKKTLHILTHDAMWGCGLTSLVVCIDDKLCDIRERNMTIRSENWTTNIFSLRFQDIGEWVILWRFILWSSECTPIFSNPVPTYKPFPPVWNLCLLKSIFKPSVTGTCRLMDAWKSNGPCLPKSSTF